MNKSDTSNPSLVDRLLSIPQRVVGRLLHCTSVVRCENNDRVFVHAGGFEGVHNLANTSVHRSYSSGLKKAPVVIAKTVLEEISDASVL